MANVCDWCGKGSQKGHAVSHAKNRSIKRFKPNLHWQRVVESGMVVRRRLCTRCLKTAVRPGKKAPAKTKKPAYAFSSSVYR